MAPRMFRDYHAAARRPGLIKLMLGPAAERWQSGRMRQTRNLLYPLGYRGFESLSLRHILKHLWQVRFHTACLEGG